MQSARMGRAPLHMPVPGLGVKAFLDLSKTRSSVVSVLISLIVLIALYLVFFAVSTYQKFCKSVRKLVVQFVFGKLRWFFNYFRRFYWLKSSLLVIISGIYIGLSGLFYNVTLVLFIVFWPLELCSGVWCVAIQSTRRTTCLNFAPIGVNWYIYIKWIFSVSFCSLVWIFIR